MSAVSIPSMLGILYGVSELGLALFKRAGSGSARAGAGPAGDGTAEPPGTRDRGTLWLLWIVILASVVLAFSLVDAFPRLGFGSRDTFIRVGTVIFAAGIAIRWYAIVHLGRLFTVDVAIASDHRLVESGPYRLVRHPSYSGALLAFLGLGICLCNFASVAALVVPTLLVFLRRIQVEEAALSAALGDPYRDYMRRTKRLIPAIY